MNLRMLVAPLLLAACAGQTPSVTPVGDVRAAEPPIHWSMSRMASATYTIADTADGGQMLTLNSIPGTTPRQGEFGIAMASLDATPFHGRRVRLQALLSTDTVANYASTWLSLSAPGGRQLAMENNSWRGLRGSVEWTQQTTVLNVPNDAATITYGVILSGVGSVHAKGWHVDVIDMAAVDAAIAPEARQLLDSALVIARAYSLWRDTVSWAPLTVRLHRALAGAQSADDAYPVVSMLLSALGDHHSFLMRPAQVAAQMAQSRGTTAGGGEPPVEGRMLADGRLGYLQIPDHGGRDVPASQSYVRQGREQLAEQSAAGACGWVVDLRQNGGGNMWPMLAVVAPLVGTDALGTFVVVGGLATWTVRGMGGGSFNDRMLIGMPEPARALQAAPVAVLTGRRTTSSGEAVAISFRGRPATRSFGAPTGGLSTANSEFPLPGGGVMVVTTGLDADRLGNRYGGAINPDVFVSDDAVLSSAEAWLLSQPPCAKAR